VTSPYLTSKEAVAYLRLNSLSSLYYLVREHRLPHCRRGGLYLFDTREMDAWLRGQGSALELVRSSATASRRARS
jgi:excisionase family DNA binding protein